MEARKILQFLFFVDTSVQKGKQRSLFHHNKIAKTLSSFCLDILADGGKNSWEMIMGKCAVTSR